MHIDFNGLVSFFSVLRFYKVIEYCRNSDNINQLNWSIISVPKQLMVNNLPQRIKDSLIPKYKDWPDITAALKLPADPNFNINDVFDYMLQQDKYYEGTKHELHLFEVYPELEEYYK